MWQSELPPYERRQNDAYLMTIDRLSRQIDTLQVVVPRLEVLQERLDSHVAQGARFQQEVRGLITEAFLDGDLDLHKEEHKTMRARTRLCRTFFDKLTDRAMSGTSWALLTVLAALILYWWNGNVPDSLKLLK